MNKAKCCRKEDPTIPTTLITLERALLQFVRLIKFRCLPEMNGGRDVSLKFELVLLADQNDLLSLGQASSLLLIG